MTPNKVRICEWQGRNLRYRCTKRAVYLVGRLSGPDSGVWESRPHAFCSTHAFAPKTSVIYGVDMEHIGKERWRVAPRSEQHLRRE